MAINAKVFRRPFHAFHIFEHRVWELTFLPFPVGYVYRRLLALPNVASCLSPMVPMRDVASNGAVCWNGNLVEADGVSVQGRVCDPNETEAPAVGVRATSDGKGQWTSAYQETAVTTGGNYSVIQKKARLSCLHLSAIRRARWFIRC